MPVKRGQDASPRLFTATRNGEQSAAWVWLVAWILCVAMATLYPFDFGFVQKEARQVFFGRGLQLSDGVDIGLNLLLFLPIGALISHLAERRCAPARARLILTATVALGISALVECLQIYLPGRHSSLADILSNTAGAAAGALAQQNRLALAAGLRGIATPSRLTSAAVVYATLVLTLSGVLQRHSRLDNWSLDYPLLIGNEESGDRPWKGRVFYFELTDAAISQGSLRRFSAGEPAVVSGSRIARADFVGNAAQRDAAPDVPQLQWSRRGATADAGHVHQRSWLRSQRDASFVARRIRETNAFTLLVRCATDDVDQHGPARIISNSADESHRNFTLGQQDRAAIFRLRTWLTGPNGTNPEAVVDGVFTDTLPRELLISYDGATLWTAVGGSGAVQAMRFTPGASMKALFDPIRADELEAQRIGFLAALFVVPGAVFGALSGTTARRVALCGTWVLVFTVLLEAALMQASGRRFEWNAVAATALVGVLVVTLVGGTTSFITAQRSA